MQLRLAVERDVEALARLVDRAFTPYIAQIGARPVPMDDDYAALVATEQVWVAVDAATAAVIGVLVLAAAAEHVRVLTAAVDPDRQGEGIGRVLLTHAEDEARARGVAELRLYTNALMMENRALYAHLGYAETGVDTVGARQRVSFVKRLR